MEAKIYNQKGASAGSIKLPEAVFGLKWNSDLVHQVVESMRSNKRAGTADTKDRGEVRGGGKKPWKQKGTGRARHGSSRSPIWVGGGVTHGPLSEKNYKRKINSKMRTKALFSVLSRKFRDGEIIFVDSLAMSEMKTKEAAKVMAQISKGTGIKAVASYKKPVIYMAFWGKDDKKKKSYRNLPQIEQTFVNNLNTYDVLNHKYLMIENPEESIKFLESKMVSNKNK